MSRLPSRLHHTAYVTKDLEATRAFYEDVLGIPLAATWCETDFLFGKDRTYCHCFFELGDKSCLAFFQFADPEDQALFDPELAPSPFRHVALNVDQETQAELERRIEAAGLEGGYTLEHGYCRSVYVTDPNGMIVASSHASSSMSSGIRHSSFCRVRGGNLPASFARSISHSGWA